VALNPEAVALAAKINKEHGEGALITASEMQAPPRFPSGSPTLDLALGGGWPGNQWVEVYGPESNGKTAIVLKTIAANQALDPDFTTLWVAGEHYDYDQASALGVNNDQVVVLDTQDMVLAFETMLDYAESRAADAIVLDSYPALIPPEEEQKDLDEAVVAVGARLFGKFFRKAGKATRRSHIHEDRPLLGIIINQQRDKIGGFAPHGMIPQTTPGGNAKNYAFYTRVLVKRDEYIQESVPGKNLKVKVGQVIKVTTIKNKSNAPQQVANIDFYFRDGVTSDFKRGEYDTTKELIILGLLYDLIVRKGAYFEYGEHRWRGRDAMVDGIREDLDVQQALEREVSEVALHKGPMEITEENIEKATSEGKRRVSRRSEEDSDESAA
jgi:recombination protein RecA